MTEEDRSFTPDDWLSAQALIESGHCPGAHRQERASVVALAEAFAEARKEGQRAGQRGDYSNGIYYVRRIRGGGARIVCHPHGCHDGVDSFVLVADERALAKLRIPTIAEEQAAAAARPPKTPEDRDRDRAALQHFTQDMPRRPMTDEERVVFGAARERQARREGLVRAFNVFDPRGTPVNAESMPAWPVYEIDTDDVCTLDGFDGVGLMTGDVRDGLRMSRETARKLADRLDAWLRTTEAKT